jgi:hypothetical protein
MRCRKQGAGCNYPPPPDRKRIAQRTSRLRALHSTTVIEHARISGSPNGAPVAKRPRTGDGTKEQHVPQPQDIPPAEDGETADLPSTEIGLLLLEVYFKRIYFAPPAVPQEHRISTIYAEQDTCLLTQSYLRSCRCLSERN